MLPWKTLRNPKGMGGLGIRDVCFFNLALLGRKVWRLINNKDSLCYKVLSSRYFLDGNIFKAKRVDKASFTDADQDDKMIWFHNLHGCFTTKLAYLWLLLKEMGFDPHRIYWKAIRKLKTLPKVRVFAWRMGHEILPTMVKIAFIR
ncbi:Cyclopropane-fatty-acyl-phospholipid synthase [Gossypium australe]|uniref:Cyclopropane-fatty-acyl-phospholipid synthase n=1 Tax=Gossypium australe TaxID=47621 RepID=A0A5B6VG47_9ROSI|nr:Cyclopropane-fatty-acyl-phospholipid synthase [Gossypium australe]